MNDPAYGYNAIASCLGGEEGHLDHLDLNGECPWCGVITQELAKLLEEAENN